MTLPRLGPKAFQRLWDFIVVGEPDACWMWVGPVYDTECARFCFTVAGKKHSTTARSLLFIELYGPVPSGTRVYNACDSRICMNPEHFYLAPCGYHRGNRMSGAFLTLEKAREIRQKKIENPDISYRKLGALWGVTGGTAFNICKNRIWSEPKWPYRNSIPTASTASTSSDDESPGDVGGLRRSSTQPVSSPLPNTVPPKVVSD